MKITVRKIGSRWQPVNATGNVIRGSVYNADGGGYKTKQGAEEAAEVLRELQGWGVRPDGAAHSTMQQGFLPFETWDDVLEAASRGDHLWYQAPFDARPKSIHVAKVLKNGELRIDPLSKDAGKFTADSGHLSRFRRRS